LRRFAAVAWDARPVWFRFWFRLLRGLGFGRWAGLVSATTCFDWLLVTIRGVVGCWLRGYMTLVTFER